MSAIAEALQHLARATLGGDAALGTGDTMLRLVRALGDRRDQADTQVFAGFCRLFLRAYENYEYDIERNGEAWLLGRLAALNPQVVFDVGANVGDWSLRAARLLPGATIHAFEPVPTTFEILARRLGPLGPRVHANPFGLSDKDGEIALNVIEGDSTLSSFVSLHEGRQQRVACAVRAGDAYLAERGVGRIDLLKIDVEGAEPLVLAGLARALGEGRIDAIQFEYGQANILTKFLLRDFYQVLEQAGYAVGKLYPTRVDFRAYRFEHEDFVGPNFVAVRQSHERLKNLLAGK